MADNFEKAKDDILRRTAGNGGPTTADLLIAIQGLADDQDIQHDESMQEIKRNRLLLEGHFIEATNRDKRIEKLEGSVQQYERDCPARLESLLEEAVARSRTVHHEDHNRYVEQLEQSKRRAGDPKDADWTPKRSNASAEAEKQVWLMWMVGSKLGYILLAVLVAAATWATHWLLTGNP